MGQVIPAHIRLVDKDGYADRSWWRFFANIKNVPGSIVSVIDFGARGDGVTDDLAAITAAIASLVANGGGILYFPAGTFLVSGSIEYPSNIMIVGAGRGVTIIKLATGSGLNSSDGIFHPGPVGAALPAIGYRAKNVYIAHFSIDGNVAGNVGQFYEGIAGYQAKDLVVEDVESYNCGECGFQGQVTNVGTDQKSLISFINCIAHDNVADGFQIGGASLANCYAYSNSGAGIDSVGNFVSGNVDDVVTTITNCRADANTNGGIVSVLQNGPHIRTVISNCSAHRNGTVGGGGVGIAAAMKYTEIVNCDVQYNQADGIFLQFDNCSVTGGCSNNNGQSALGATNFRSGICIFGNVNYVNVTGVTCTDFQGSPTQQYSVAFSGPGSGSNNLLADCILTGNVNALPYQFASAIDWRIIDNVGVNPAGVFGAAGLPANPAVPASTVTKTNTYSYPAMVAISGGAVTAIAINGTATGLTFGTFEVGPGQTIAITYTVVPAWQWFGL